jgi:hypothetical protein
MNLIERYRQRTEEKTYKKNEARLMEAHKGEWVLIKGKKLIDVFTSEDKAFENGFAMFSRKQFHIRQIGVEQTILVTNPLF